MTNLFEPKKNPEATTYSAADIEVLEGLEPVRHRPGMYIGGTDERALHHLAAEILDNSMDEAVAGHATRIMMHLAQDDTLTIKDNGRGIPTDPHPKYPDRSALEVILTTLHAGGKFKEGAYETAGGLHGVGLSVVNALADHLKVEVVRNKEGWQQTYEQGRPVTTLLPMEKLVFQKGTAITFHPDPEIFGTQAHFKVQTLYKMARSKAYLYRGVQIDWSADPELVEGTDVPAKELIHFPEGLVDYLTYAIKTTAILFPKPFYGTIQFPHGEGRIEWAITWTPSREGNLQSYCNTIPTPLGGSHEAGFRSSLLKALKSFGDLKKNKKTALITGDDLLYNATALLSVFIKDPQFQGQTKEKLSTPKTTRLIEASFKDHCDHWLVENNDEGQKLLDHAIQKAEDRQRLRALKDTQRKSATQRLRLPGKLADCTRQQAEGTEIFLVEGDSAGGSAKQARDRATQAVLPLRGKILNVANATLDKIAANQEIKDLSQALGIGFGKDFQLDKIRYERVVIMTDADVDGAHIAALLMTFFFQKMRPLIERGHLYLAQPPLYRISSGAKAVYAQDDAEKEHLLETTFKGASKIEIGRFKGLGEMTAKQLKETTMDPKTRTFLRVDLPKSHELDDTNIAEFVDNLMGKQPEKRFVFIQENARFVDNLDV